ncbi:MAG: NAD(P)/FAD-dependent oxidoreductase [Gemmatimonadaceae bacterium]
MEMTGRAGSSTDVVVVGGGPAGCAAAIAAQRAGARVTLLERETVARDRPGETLAPGMEPLLDWLGAGDLLANATLVRHEGHWVESRDGRRYVAFGRDASGPWRGFQVWRRTLDGSLRQRAADLGVDVRLGEVARSILHDRSAAVRGVVLRHGARVRAHVVIDASGGRHWLARALGLGVARLSPRYVATYGYSSRHPEPLTGHPEPLTGHPERSERSAVRGRLREGSAVPLFRFDNDGWTWIAPLGERGWAWTQLSFAGKKTTAGRGADVTWRIARSVAGPGWLIAGDAGAVLDPAASHGVLRAIMSGARAGLAAAGARRDRDASRASFAGFDGWFRAGVLRDAAILRQTYAAAMRDEERRAG